ncbi:M50 family metallopeptidase [Ponticaulis profundi]|uniref:M50 family metallopeptidase n=1 Tax=Ponticaulis profundi TaxID=2665222 RepID=A0ABW1SEV7_9PROT
MSLPVLTLIYLLTPIIVISVVIIIHELGHYWAGRAFNSAIKSYSIGFGPQLLSLRDKRGTDWKISALPLGGFVSWFDDDDPELEKRNAAGVQVSGLNVWKRAVIAVAGPLANFILAIAVFAGFGMTLGDPLVQIQITNVEENSAAQEAGLLPGDIFLEVNGREANKQDRFQQEIKLSSGDPVRFVVERDGAPLAITATPKRAEMDNGVGIKQQTGKLGIEYRPTLVDRNRLNPVAAIGYGARETYNAVATSIRMLGRIVTGKESIQSLSGPVGIANTVGTTAKASLEIEQISFMQRLYVAGMSMLQLIAYISVAVGFFNLLPLPILDGGRLVFHAYEALTGRLPSERIEAVSMTLTLAFLAMMALFITIGDFQETGLLEVFRGL